LLEEFVADTFRLDVHGLCHKYGRRPSTIKDWRIYARHQGIEVGYGPPNEPGMPPAGIRFYDRRVPSSVSDRRLWELAADANEVLNELRLSQDKAELAIEENLPIGIAFVGDLHIGAVGVDYEAMNDDFGLLAGSDGVYCIGMGDYAHNPQISKRQAEGLYRMVLPKPGHQYRLVKWQFRKLKGRWIALIRGCHDDFDMQISGGDRLEDLCLDLECVNLWHGGLVTIYMPDVTYEILARHKYKYESSLNTTNAQRRAYDVLYPADLIALGHKHFGDMQKVQRGELKQHSVVYLRSGTYLVVDEFGQRIGGFHGEVGVPLAVFYPDEKRIIPFSGPDLQVGLRFLAQERELYRLEKPEGA